MSAKDEVIEYVRSLPDDATVPDIVDALDARFGFLDEDGQELTREQWEAEWAEEINRRVEDIRSGRVKMVPGDEVMARLREKFG